MSRLYEGHYWKWDMVYGFSLSVMEAYTYYSASRNLSLCNYGAFVFSWIRPHTIKQAMEFSLLPIHIDRKSVV